MKLDQIASFVKCILPIVAVYKGDYDPGMVDIKPGRIEVLGNFNILANSPSIQSIRRLMERIEQLKKRDIT